MQAYQALTYGQKLRVGRCLIRGEAPADPRLATAAVELAEKYQRQSRGATAFIRWGPAFIVLASTYLMISAIDKGDELLLITSALVILGHVAQYTINPATRPKNTARALEASRRIAAAST
jgi:hypothetical protein